MAFAGDPIARRTRDEERGLELFSDGGGPDGMQYYRITNNEGEAISFSTRWEQSFVDRWRERNPSASKPAIYLVRSLRGIFSGLSREETDKIIIEALEAFQGFHGKPGDADVAVFFEDENGEVV